MARRRSFFVPPSPVAAADPYDAPYQTHEVGSFGEFIGDAPPQPYRYDPRQRHDPEDFPPAPPGYGERGGQYLLPDENVSEPAYLPQNPDGSISRPQEIGPEPPTFYATNVADTARKWSSQGQKYTFLAESPGAMKTAREIGAPEIMKGYKDESFSEKEIGPEPKPGELDEMGQFNQFWGHVVKEKWNGEDPTKINPAELGVKKREELQRKYDLELFNRDAGSAEYKRYEKLIEQGAKDEEHVAERRRAGAMEEKRVAHDFFKEKLKATREEEKANRPKPVTQEQIKGAQEYTQRALFGVNSWQNKILTPEEQVLADADPKNPPPIPRNRRFQPRILADVNRVREKAGLPPMVEKQDPSRRMREVTTFLGLELGEPTFTTEPGGYGYEEGQAPARRSAAAPRGTAATGPGGGMPPVKALKEGVATHFNNGQIWALQGGQPTRIK